MDLIQICVYVTNVKISYTEDGILLKSKLRGKSIHFS